MISFYKYECWGPVSLNELSMTLEWIQDRNPHIWCPNPLFIGLYCTHIQKALKQTLPPLFTLPLEVGLVTLCHWRHVSFMAIQRNLISQNEVILERNRDFLASWLNVSAISPLSIANNFTDWKFLANLFM